MWMLFLGQSFLVCKNQILKNIASCKPCVRFKVYKYKSSRVSQIHIGRSGRCLRDILDSVNMFENLLDHLPLRK